MMMKLYINDEVFYKQPKVGCVEDVFKEGFYKSLKPANNIIHAIQYLYAKGMDVQIISFFVHSPYAKKEKVGWLKKYLPMIPLNKIIFIEYGSKNPMQLQNIDPTDVLIDVSDHKNKWKGIFIQMVNGAEENINMININNDSTVISTDIKMCIYDSLIKKEYTGGITGFKQKKETSSNRVLLNEF